MCEEEGHGNIVTHMPVKRDVEGAGCRNNPVNTTLLPQDEKPCYDFHQMAKEIICIGKKW